MHSPSDDEFQPDGFSEFYPGFGPDDLDIANISQEWESDRDYYSDPYIQEWSFDETIFRPLNTLAESGMRTIQAQRAERRAHCAHYAHILSDTFLSQEGYSVPLPWMGNYYRTDPVPPEVSMRDISTAILLTDQVNQWAHQVVLARPLPDGGAAQLIGSACRLLHTLSHIPGAHVIMASMIDQIEGAWSPNHDMPTAPMGDNTSKREEATAASSHSDSGFFSGSLSPVSWSPEVHRNFDERGIHSGASNTQCENQSHANPGRRHRRRR
jgi:hypothetical protein